MSDESAIRLSASGAPPRPIREERPRGHPVPGIDYGVDAVTDKFNPPELVATVPEDNPDARPNFVVKDTNTMRTSHAHSKFRMRGDIGGSKQFRFDRRPKQAMMSGGSSEEGSQRSNRSSSRMGSEFRNIPVKLNGSDDEEEEGSEDYTEGSGSYEDDEEEGSDDYTEGSGSYDEDGSDEEGSYRSNKPKMSYEEIRNKKIEYLAALKRLEDQGYEAAGKKCGLTSSLEEIEEVLEKLRAQRDLDNSIKFQRDILVTFVGMIEYGCSYKEYNIFELDLEGWSKAVFENITEYDEVFEELHYKYKTTMAIPPELKLLGMLTMSGYRYHLSRQLINKAEKTMPGFSDVVNSDPELKRRYQETAMRMGKMPPPPTSMTPPPKSSRTPMSDPDDVDGLLAGLKGGKQKDVDLSEADLFTL